MIKFFLCALPYFALFVLKWNRKIYPFARGLAFFEQHRNIENIVFFTTKSQRRFLYPTPETQGHKDLIRWLINQNHQPHRHKGHLVCFPANAQILASPTGRLNFPRDCLFECRCKRCIENKRESKISFWTKVICDCIPLAWNKSFLVFGSFLRSYWVRQFTARIPFARR